MTDELTALVETELPKIRSFLIKRGNPDVDETVGDILLRIVRYSDQIASNPKSWLWSVAVSQHNQCFRRKWNRCTCGLDPEWEPYTTHETHDARLTVEKILECAAPKDRAILYDRYYLGMTGDEIAQREGIKKNSVRLRVFRALRNVRKEMKLRGLA